MTDTKKRAEIISTFTDQGTGETFESGATPLIEAGAFGNYEAAGLVRAPAAAAAKATTKPPRSTARKGASRTKASAPAPSATVPAAPAVPPVTGEGGPSV